MMRIGWYLEGYHGIKLSDLGIYRVLKRNGMSRLPTNAGRGGYSHRGQIVF